MTINADADLLVPHSQDPLYAQIFVILRDRILRGEWQPEEKLPSEPELIAQFQVSRTTIRLALDRLVDDGLIYRQRGRGTFVASQRMVQDPAGDVVGEAVQARRYQSSIRLLSAGITSASSHTAKQLQVASGAELVLLQRLHLSDAVPFGVESVCLVHKYCPGVLEHDLGQSLSTEVFEQGFGLRRGRVKQMVRAVAASTTTGRLLNVSVGTPLLYVERIVYLAEPDVPLELQKIHYRGDRYVLRSEL